MIQPSFARTPILDAIKSKFQASEQCWARLADSQNVLLADAPLLEPVAIAEAVIDAFLNDPGSPHTIIMKLSLESIVVRYLRSFLPDRVLDKVLTDGILQKAQRKRKEKR